MVLANSRRSLIAVVAVAAVVGIALSGTQFANASSYSSIGDVVIYSNKTYFRCDKIVCPDNTYLCHVSKNKPQPDGTVVVRIDECFAKSGDLLMNKIIEQPVNADSVVKVNITASRHGIISSSSTQYNVGASDATVGSPEWQEQMQHVHDINQQTQQQIQHQVQQQLAHINQNIQQQMQQLNHNLQVHLGNIMG